MKKKGVTDNRASSGLIGIKNNMTSGEIRKKYLDFLMIKNK